jgi:beta-lactamase class A
MSPVMRRAYLTFVLQLLVLWPVSASADGPDEFVPLREAFDPGLQTRLEVVIERLRLNAAVAEGRLAVALADITELDEPRMASLNGDHMLYAASLPKIAILLGAFVEVERGRLALTRETRRSLTDMVRVSSNAEATRMLNRVGKRNLLEILRSNRFRFYDPATNGGLWVGKEYGKSPAYQRDPLHNLSHGATALQTARFYYLLEAGRLVDAKLGHEMKRMLGKPGIEHKFVKGLSDFPGAQIYRKSGSWGRWHSDSAIVEDGGRRYILVGLAEDPLGGRWLEELAHRVHPMMVPRRLVRLTH